MKPKTSYSIDICLWNFQINQNLTVQITSFSWKMAIKLANALLGIHQSVISIHKLDLIYSVGKFDIEIEFPFKKIYVKKIL